ncbi:50S ribosomal protein L17 [Candidatus Berkelbacteria bacterium]|nr:50S ribosomal protein L17 [Candidatus Berkelbacteria bacterium]
MKTSSKISHLTRNQLASLILYEKILTTKVRAKLLKSAAERMIEIGKSKNTLLARRRLLSILFQERAVDKVLEVLAPRFKDRTGGYARARFLKRRLGDFAPLYQVEFIQEKKKEKLDGNKGD